MTRLGRLLEEFLGPDCPFAVVAYDGTEFGPPAAKATVVVHSPDALRRIVTRPGELGFARAYVAGDVDIEGDIYELFRVRDRIPSPRFTPHAAPSGRPDARPPPPAPAGAAAGGDAQASVRRPHHPPGRRVGPPPLRRVATLLRAGARPGDDLLVCPVRPARRQPGRGPGREARPDLPQARRCGRACACWTSGAAGARMALHAATHHGVEVVGVTISPRAGRAGAQSGGRASRPGRPRGHPAPGLPRASADGPFDAISSIGHVRARRGRAHGHVLRRTCYELLGPRGRLLNHAISRPAGPSLRASAATASSAGTSSPTASSSRSAAS